MEEKKLYLIIMAPYVVFSPKKLKIENPFHNMLVSSVQMARNN